MKSYMSPFRDMNEAHAHSAGLRARRPLRLHISTSHPLPFSCVQDMSFTYPPQDTMRSLVVEGSQLRYLKDGEYLNDTVMDFYGR